MQKKQPNVVLIFVDNQPANMLGSAGNTEIHTPHLDRLAEQAVRFSEAYCPNAMCSPCRASVLTGLMPSQHGVHTWLDDATIADWPKNWSAVDTASAAMRTTAISMLAVAVRPNERWPV